MRISRRRRDARNRRSSIPRRRSRIPRRRCDATNRRSRIPRRRSRIPQCRRDARNRRSSIPRRRSRIPRRRSRISATPDEQDFEEPKSGESGVAQILDRRCGILDRRRGILDRRRAASRCVAKSNRRLQQAGAVAQSCATAHAWHACTHANHCTRTHAYMYTFIYIHTYNLSLHIYIYIYVLYMYIYRPAHSCTGSWPLILHIILCNMQARDDKDTACTCIITCHWDCK